MKRFTGLFLALFFVAVMAAPSFAGPSRAVIQEMGSVVAADEVNVDLDWLAGDLGGDGVVAAGAGGVNIGAIDLSSVNVGIREGVELRLGRLPGTAAYANLNELGVTIKAAIPNVDGLAAWLGYGIKSTESAVVGNDQKDSTLTLGAAYTHAGPVILNGAVGYSMDKTTTNGVDGNDQTTMELSVAALYPLSSAIIIGGELVYLSLDNGAAVNPKTTVMTPALAARLTKGNFTIDAAFAFVGSGVDDEAAAQKSTNTQIGVPNLRVNYTF